MEIKDCHVCGSVNIVKDIYCQEYVSVTFSKTVKYKEFGFFGKKSEKKVVDTTAIRVAICKDCGSVRLYVYEPERDWLTYEQYMSTSLNQ